MSLIPKKSFVPLGATKSKSERVDVTRQPGPGPGPGRSAASPEFPQTAAARKSTVDQEGNERTSVLDHEDEVSSLELPRTAAFAAEQATEEE